MARTAKPPGDTAQVFRATTLDEAKVAEREARVPNRTAETSPAVPRHEVRTAKVAA